MVTDAADALLAEIGRARVVAREPLAEARGRVARLTLDPALGAHATVVAKERALDEWSAPSLGTEAAALAAVAAAGVDLAPRLLAGSAEAGVLVLTDVGARTVESCLFEGDAPAAEAALVRLAGTAAALHRIAVDRPLGGPAPAWTVGQALRTGALAAAVDETGFPPGDGAAADAASVAAALAEPGRFGALVHGDLTPNNAVLGDDGRCRLVDFEGAGRQHAGIDACMLRFPFAWYGRWALVPDRVQHAMEGAYRDAVGWPARDVDVAIATGCAAMALLRLQRLPRIADPGQPPDSRYRRRVQIASTVDVAAAALDAAGIFPALRAWFGEVVAVARARWEEASLPPPVFPAFR